MTALERGRWVQLRGITTIDRGSGEEEGPLVFGIVQTVDQQAQRVKVRLDRAYGGVIVEVPWASATIVEDAERSLPRDLLLVTHFTLSETSRLRFVRWLYCSGRISE